ncbi:hypothetical protein [Pseudoalteromonas sp. MMG005]|uniref:hypothetical protein n=1 Tax=Pseudoalteromonas sp. MMG005 TaxID=2822682 RepID=UPI001B3A04C3|nr:hypothetical protein [Pseudoalteromonas sp. MMG005]MBQ4847135.1 hypothetical protein [Pseudoalteromonas sp. MMG005]
MKYMVILGALALVAGCGSQQYNETQVVSEKKAFKVKSEYALLGSWKGDTAQIEFHGSHFNQVFSNSFVQQSQVQTGRYSHDGIVQKFHWSLDSAGIVTLNIVDGTCGIVPLDYCNVSAKKQITLSGSDISAATWEIKTDGDLDGVYESTTSERVVRNEFSDTQLHAGKQFLKLSDNFDRPLEMVVNDDVVNLLLPISTASTHKYVRLSGAVKQSDHSIIFDKHEGTTLSEPQRFKVANEADVLLDVESQISDVVLRSGLGDSVVIDYLITRKIVMPDNLTASQLDLSQFKVTERHTIVTKESVALLSDLSINLNETYYSKIPAGFSASADGAGHQIVFHEGNTGVISFIDPSSDNAENTQTFTWEYKNDQQVHVALANGISWDLGFTGTVLGGYSAIYQNESNDIYGHDFLTQGYVDPNTLVPGRFTLENTDGLSTVDVEFKENGEILIQAGPISFSGFWAVTDEREIVSFECEQHDGVLVTELDLCKSQLQLIGTDESTLKFGHIRKFKFLHSNGNKLVSTYNATAWGEPLTTGAVPVHFNWVYRWQRVGD